MEIKLNTVFKTLILAIVLFLMMISVARFIGLGKSGFLQDEINSQWNFYVGPAVGELLGIILLAILSFYLFKGKTYGQSVAFNSPGESPAIETNFVKNPFKLALLSLIIFSIIGLWSTFTKQTFIGVAVLQHQFTLLDNVLFSSALVPAAENIGAAFLLAFVLFILAYYCLKNNVQKSNYIILSIFLAPLVFMLYGVINHLLRYSNSDVAMVSVAIFWAAGGLITILSGSFIPFWILHAVNNAFLEFSKSVQSNETILVWTIGIEIIMIVLFFLLFTGKKKTGVTQ